MNKISRCTYVKTRPAADCCPTLVEEPTGVFTWDRGDGSDPVVIDTNDDPDRVNTSTFSQDVATGDITHNSGEDGAADDIAVIREPASNNAISTGLNGGNFLDCSKLKSYEYPEINEIWDGSQTEIVLPVPTSGIYTKFSFFHEGVKFSLNDGTIDYSLVENKSFQVVFNADGSATITPDVALGEADYPCRITVEAVIEKDCCS